MTDSIKSVGLSTFFSIDQLSKELKNLGFGKTGTSSAESGLPDMLKEMGIDGIQLSPDATRSLQYSKAQFEMNYQTMKSVNSANGIETSELTFSFSASFEFLQNISGGSPVAKGDPTETTNADGSEQTESAGSESSGETDLLAKLKEFFSPEKTAQRILDFALHFFPMSSYGKEGNTEDTRQNFSDFIGKAIQTGFDQAFQILGNIPGEVKSTADKTHDLVFQGLDNFVKNGLAPEKSAGGVLFERIEAYRLEMSITAETSSSRKSGSDAYDTTGLAGKRSEPAGGKIDTQY
ncbi:MAG TPA: DUF5610 domain-containing protein [Candidatus Ozemobacteraceae bacterium]|nr:DUF5610 domain-containing protein [Candidatus Ozemobacteraceae bacterium]